MKKTKAILKLLIFALCPLLIVSCTPNTSKTESVAGVEPYTKYLQNDKDMVLKELKITSEENSSIVGDDGELILTLKDPVKYIGEECEVSLNFTGNLSLDDENSILANRLEQFTYLVDFKGKDTQTIAKTTSSILDKMKKAYEPYLGECTENVVTKRGELSSGNPPSEPFSEATLQKLLQEFESGEDDTISIVTEWFLPKLTEYTNIPSEVKEHLSDNLTYRVIATLDYQDEQYMLYVSHFVSEAR